MTVVRRSAGWFGAALVFGLLSIPAIFDLKTLFVGLAVICAGLGIVTAAYTWFDRERRPEPPPGARPPPDVEPVETQ